MVGLQPTFSSLPALLTANRSGAHHEIAFLSSFLA